MKHLWHTHFSRFLITLAFVMLVGCAQQTSAPEATQPATSLSPVVKTAVSQFEPVRVAAQKYLESDKSKTPNVNAEDVYYNLNDGDKSNDPLIIDIRAAADYEKGHIPGAISIPWREIAKPENLAKLAKGKPIVVYCYTGHSGSQTAAMLSMLGYDAKNLKFGMTAWTKNETIAPNRFDEKNVKDYKVETTVNVPTKSYSYPVLNVSSSGDSFEIVRAAIDAYLKSDKSKTSTIRAEDVYYNLNDGNASSKPMVLSVRAKADYELGHVPGAVNIPWQAVANPDNLAKLPADQPLIVYCYTGHTGGQATAILNTLGYSAKNMMYGLSGWSKDMTVVKSRFDNVKDAKEYKLVVGSNPL